MEKKQKNVHDHSLHHPWCIATIAYNVIVILIEVVIIGVLNHMEWHELLSYEGMVQLFHLGGMIVLGIINWYWVHRYDHIKIKGFISIAGVMLAAHIILLHLLPRVIGMEVHHHDHDSHGHISETQEYLILLVVITFVTFAFIYREKLLKSLNIKNRWQINLF